jgi:hypothetical protein
MGVSTGDGLLGLRFRGVHRFSETELHRLESGDAA